MASQHSRLQEELRATQNNTQAIYEALIRAGISVDLPSSSQRRDEEPYQSSYCILIVSLHYQYSALRLNTSLHWIYTTQTPYQSSYCILIVSLHYQYSALRLNTSLHWIYTTQTPFVSLPIRYFNAGKSIYANIQQFLQHFLIMSSSSSLIILLGTVAFGDAPLTAWDLLWVNLVEAVLGGYVSLTKPSIDIPMKSISGKRLITPSMTKNISLQVLYQTVWCMGLQKATGVGAMVSNSFILCQFFNIVNARELEIKNIFGGISRHAVGVWIAGIIFMALQVGFVMIDEWFGYGAKLDWKLWVVCLVIGLGSWLVDYVYRRASGQKSEPK